MLTVLGPDLSDLYAARDLVEAGMLDLAECPHALSDLEQQRVLLARAVRGDLERFARRGRPDVEWDLELAQNLLAVAKQVTLARPLLDVDARTGELAKAAAYQLLLSISRAGYIMNLHDGEARRRYLLDVVHRQGVARLQRDDEARAGAAMPEAA